MSGNRNYIGTITDSEIEYLSLKVIQEFLTVDNESDRVDAVGGISLHMTQIHSSAVEGSSSRSIAKDPA